MVGGNMQIIWFCKLCVKFLVSSETLGFLVPQLYNIVTHYTSTFLLFIKTRNLINRPNYKAEIRDRPRADGSPELVQCNEC